MIGSVSFQTRARTVDHLGREQIADTPTAISELWKNAYDAYARNVALDIYAGEVPVAVVSDGGHGMNRAEFESRWLVVGTESKATNSVTPLSDCDGLPLRPRQGQKGIGRLSCANLGPLLLLVSKRKGADLVAALLDWRLFENPFLNLSGVRVPVVGFSDAAGVLEEMAGLRAALETNVLGDGGDAARDERLRAAWASWDEVERDRSDDAGFVPPSRRIVEDIRRPVDRGPSLRELGAWTGERDQGTAMLVLEINYDLLVELDPAAVDTSALAVRRRFFETLTGFVDSFVDRWTAGAAEAPGSPAGGIDTRPPDFDYAIRAWSEGGFRLVVSPSKEFSRSLLDGMEHILVGKVDADGVSERRVKAFGRSVSEPCRIEPPKDLIIPHRADSALGPFDLYIASMEFVAASSTLPRLEFQKYKELAEKYSGFMIFRDGLPVLPYGREDNDSFEIESRRSRSAGREFWNHRQMFGRLAISRDSNPNLKDKAGREGLLDNRAGKTLKEVVSARLYFGSASDTRGDMLPQVKASNKAARAAEARNKLRQKRRKEFRGKLVTYAKELPALVAQLEDFVQDLQLPDEYTVSAAQDQVEQFRERLEGYRLGAAPKNLGSLEEPFTTYRESQRSAGVLLTSVRKRSNERSN